MIQRGERVWVNTGGVDWTGEVTGTEADWRRLYPHALKAGGPAVCVKFDAGHTEQWIPAQYVRRAE